MKVAGLVLAAGGGSRVGRPKAEILLGGRRLVDVSIGSCVQAGLSPVVVVLGATWLTPMPPPSTPDGRTPKITLVDNTEWATGIASSLRAGLEVLPPDPEVEAVIITLVDTPSVTAEHLHRIASALADGATAAVATYDGAERTPVGLARSVWTDVAASVAGDQGARVWLQAHPGLVTHVECGDLGSWTDIDTPQDLPE
jgi:CTP:molybdopterin cytidylyltransferase MocA